MKHERIGDDRLRRYDWRRAMYAGLDMAMEQVRAGQEVGDREIMWALLCEAADVSQRTYSGPPRLGLPRKSAMPDAPDEISQWQLVSAYLRGDLEEMPVEDSQPPQPDAAQITRAEMVLEVWHRAALTGYGDWRRMRKAIYMKACGMPDRKVRALTGFSRQRRHKAKQRAMDDMLEFIGFLR